MKRKRLKCPASGGVRFLDPKGLVFWELNPLKAYVLVMSNKPRDLSMK